MYIETTSSGVRPRFLRPEPLRPPSEHSENPWGRPQPSPARGLYYNAFFVRATDVSATIFWRHAHVPISSGDRWPGAQPSPTRQLNKWGYTTTSNVPKGHNTCKWLTLSSTELCGKSCLTDFCKVHLLRLRKGSLTQPCRGCGVGVTNKQQLCCQCGYRIERCRAARAARKEFARLAAIEISI